MSLTTLNASFRHGIHPQESKEATEHLPIARMPFVERYVLPLSQHTGAPSRPVVAVGERVTRGQVVAEPGGFVSTTLHAPVTGTVAALGPRRHPNGKLVECLEIATDSFSPQTLLARAPVDPFPLDRRGVRRRGAEGGPGRPRRRRLPDPRQVQAAGGQDGHPTGGQRLRVRALPHHRPPPDGRTPGRHPARHRHRRPPAARRGDGDRRRDQQAGRDHRPRARDRQGRRAAPRCASRRCASSTRRAPRRCSSRRSTTSRCRAASCRSTSAAWSTTSARWPASPTGSTAASR